MSLEYTRRVVREVSKHERVKLSDRPFSQGAKDVFEAALEARLDNCPAEDVWPSLTQCYAAGVEEAEGPICERILWRYSLPSVMLAAERYVSLAGPARAHYDCPDVRASADYQADSPEVLHAPNEAPEVCQHDMEHCNCTSL